MSIATGNQPPMRGHGILSMFLIIFILSLFISFCAAARCDAGSRTIYLYMAYLRAYTPDARQRLSDALHHCITRMATAVVPVLDGASAKGQPRLLHRDGVGIRITGLQRGLDQILV